MQMPRVFQDTVLHCFIQLWVYAPRWALSALWDLSSWTPAKGITECVCSLGGLTVRVSQTLHGTHLDIVGPDVHLPSRLHALACMWGALCGLTELSPDAATWEDPTNIPFHRMQG